LLTTPSGFPCCVRFPCVHAVATTPAQRLGVFFALLTQPYQPSPKGCRVGLRIVLFEDCSAFTRVTACTLALSPIRDTLIEGFSHFVTSMTAPIASGWSGCRVGFAPTGKRRLVTAHTRNGPCADLVQVKSLKILRSVKAKTANDFLRDQVRRRYLGIQLEAVRSWDRQELILV
jgi:hypothetical protein